MIWPPPGNVSDGRFARVFGALVTGRLTGALRLELPGEDKEHVLYFEDGAIVDCDSRFPEDTLGRVALEAGFIDNTALGEAIRRQAAGDRTQRQVLEEMGALTGDTLERAARLTLTRKALRVFAMSAASYSVSAHPHGRGDGGPLESRWTLYRGLRLHYDERRLDMELMELSSDRAMRLAPAAAAQVDMFGFSDEERILLAYLEKGYWELEDLVEACLTMPRQVVLAAVAAMWALDVLDVQKASTVPRLRKRARETTIQMGKVRSQLQATDSLRPTSSPPLSRDSSPTAAIPPVAARPSATQSGTPARPATTPPRPTLTQQASSSRPTVTQPPVAPRTTSPQAVPPRQGASGTMPPAPARPSGSQPVLGRAPGTDPPSGPFASTSTLPGVAVGMGKVLREQIANKLAQIDSGADHFSVLEVGREASSAQIKAAYFQLAKTYHPDRLALVQLELLRPQVERIFARLSDAYAGLADEPRRREYLAVLAQGGEAAVKRRADDEAAHATRLLTAEEHFRKGEMALRRKLWPAALEEFQAALDLNDQEAEHHAYIAWARWNASEDKEGIFPSVKKSMNRAVELSDRCLPAFFFLGQIYTARNELDKAYNMYQRVLDLNEHHVEAKREVRIIEMRRAKGSQKGLLDLFRKK